MAGRYTDVTTSDPPSLDSSAQELLLSLKQERVPAHLSPDNIRHFSVPWKAGGIDPSDTTCAAYLSDFCDAVYTGIKGLIDRALSTQEKVVSKLVEEVHHHASFCLTKCESFHGRDDVLNKVQSHLGAKNGLPLVIHGLSGSGKTSVMAMVGSNALSWMGSSATCVLRFLGTTPASSNLRDVLASICSQICTVHQLPLPVFDHMDATQIIQFFRSRLLECLASLKDERILILLDSVDQLSPADGAHTLNWLPKVLPPNTSIIVSMLPDLHGCLDTLRMILPHERCYIQVDSMPVAIGIDILHTWLAKVKRVITPSQQDLVSRAFASHPHPLYLKLIFQLACLWKSYTDLESIVIPTSTASALHDLFDWLEEKHGKTLVRHALGFLSAAKNGLTEAELEDVLSLDDRVLDDVYQYWDPPLAGIVRIPPLIWKRIKHDIGDYLVHQHADGMTVLAWYHRQFIETAFHRYLGNSSEKSFFHSVLTSFFEGEYSGLAKKSIYLSHREIMMRDVSRQVSSQPLIFSESVYNLRKLSELPFHLVHSNQPEKLKDISLCNFEWMLCKLQATSYTGLARDYTLALSLQKDEDLSFISESLALSAHSLQSDRMSLAGQLLGRLSLVRDSTSSQHITRLLDQAKAHALDSSTCQLVPRSSCLIGPGGCLKTTLAGHTQLLQQLCIAKKSQLLVSASKGKGAAVFNIWDLSDLECIQSLHTVRIDGIGVPRLIVSGNVAAGSCGCSISIWNCGTGEQLFSSCLASEVTGLALSPDKKRLFVGTMSGALVSLYPNDSSKATELLVDHKEAVVALTIIEDGHFLVAALKDGTICITNVTSFLQEPKHVQVHSGPITCLATTSCNGVAVAVTGSQDKTVSIAQLEDGSIRHALKGHSGAVKCLCCCQPKSLPSTRTLVVTGSLDKSIRVWDIESGECLHTLNEHKDAVWCLAVLDDDLVVSGSKDDYLKVWDPVGGKCLHTLEGHSSWVSCVTSIGKDTVFSGSNDKSVKVWKLKQEQFTGTQRHSFQPECIAAPNEDTIISGSPTEMKVWRASDGACLQTLPLSASALISNGKTLLSGSRRGIVTVWDVATLQMSAQLEGHSGAISCLSLIPGSSSLIALSASADGTIRKWNVDSSLCTATLTGHTGGIKCLAISSDQSLAASGSADCTIRIWCLASNECSNILTGHSKDVGCIAFLGGSTLVASGSDDFTLRLWSSKQGTLLHVFSYADSVKCIAAVSSSLVIAGAHCDQHQLRGWNLDSGELHNEYVGHTHAVMCMLLICRGQYLVTGSRDGTVKVWEVSTSRLLASFDLQSQVKYLAVAETSSSSNLVLAATTKSGPIAIIQLKLPS